MKGEQFATASRSIALHQMITIQVVFWLVFHSHRNWQARRRKCFCHFWAAVVAKDKRPFIESRWACKSQITLVNEPVFVCTIPKKEYIITWKPATSGVTCIECDTINHTVSVQGVVSTTCLSFWKQVWREVQLPICRIHFRWWNSGQAHHKLSYQEITDYGLLKKSAIFVRSKYMIHLSLFIKAVLSIVHGLFSVNLGW